MSLRDKDNTDLLIGYMGKYFHELLQSLVNWDENLGTNTCKELSFSSSQVACKDFGLRWEHLTRWMTNLGLISGILENQDAG